MHWYSTNQLAHFRALWVCVIKGWLYLPVHQTGHYTWESHILKGTIRLTTIDTPQNLDTVYQYGTILDGWLGGFIQ